LNCDIVDLPGFGTETESDDAITLKAAQKTDILIYLSQADGFMRIEDINYLKENVRNLPVWESKSGNELKPLSNLFVVASQAHHVNNGNEIQLKGILEKGYENFAKALAKDYWRRRTEESGYTYSEKEVSSRFFTYTTDIPDLCERFLEELKKINESLPDIIDARAEDFVQGYVATRKPKLNAEIKKYKEVLENRARYVQLLDAIDDSDLKRTKENTDRKQEIVNRIESLRTESINEYSDYCSKTINTDVIAKKIKEKGIKNNKDDIQCFASQLQDEMQEECNKLLERKGQELSESIKNYISLYGDTLQAVFDN
jgi:hypothetical protein